MEGGDRNLFLSTERFLIQIAAVAVSEQLNYLFWLVSLLLHFEDLGYSNPLTRYGPVFYAAVRLVKGFFEKRRRRLKWVSFAFHCVLPESRS